MATEETCTDLGIEIPEIVSPSQLLSYHFDNVDHSRRLTDTNIIAICEVFGGIDEVLNILLSAHAHHLDPTKLRKLKSILQSTNQSICTPDIDITSITTPDTALSMHKTCSYEKDPEVYAKNGKTRYSNSDMDDEFLAEMYRLSCLELPAQGRETASSIATTTTVVTRVRSGSIHDFEKPIEWRYCFSRNNTFIHSIFGEIKGQKVFNFLYSKYVIFFIFMLGCLFPFALNTRYSNQLIKIIYFTVAVPIQILYFTFHLLSVNKKCARIIMTRFEFWLKLFYGIQFCVGTVLYWNISTVIAILLGVVTFLSIMLLSLTDGLQFKTSMKIIFGVTVSLYYTVAAGYYFLYHGYSIDNQNGNDNDMILELGHNISISLISVLTQSSQFLAIFFWYAQISIHLLFNIH